MKVTLGPFATADDGPKVSRGLRVLPSLQKSPPSNRQEMAQLKSETKSIELWWADKQRWGNTTRPYSGMSMNSLLCCCIMLNL